MKKVSDSVLLPEYTATELILSQKDDIRVASQQRGKSRLPGRGPRRRTRVPRGWQAVEGDVCVGSEYHRAVDSRVREITQLTKQARQRGSEADPQLGHFSGEELCQLTPLIIWSYALMPCIAESGKGAYSSGSLCPSSL